MDSNLKVFEPAPLTKFEAMPLDFNKPNFEVPSTYSWPSSYIDDHPIESISTPVIDLANVGQKELDQLRDVCEGWGYFQVINHGIPDKIIKDLREETVGLFSLPTEDKLRASRAKSEFYGFGQFRISEVSSNDMWHEGFAIQDHLYEHVAKIWPPNGNTKFCQVIEDYQVAVKTLAEKVLMHLLASVGLTPGDINWYEPKTNEDPFGPHNSNFLLNSYPKCPNPSKAVSLIPHSDSSLITVLNQLNNISGLQVLHDNKWVTVDPIPGAFSINIGDLMHFITNGQFVSPIHRVIPLKSDHRYSAAYFYGPPREALVTPHPKFIGPDRPQIYRPITWKDLRSIKQKYDTKVFEFMRIETVGNNKTTGDE